MAARRRAEASRLASPRLDPDDAFVERLAEAALKSQRSTGARRPLPGLRVGLATAGVVGLTVGGAWAAGNLVERGDQAPGRPPTTLHNPPISPETTGDVDSETTPPVSSTGPPGHVRRHRAGRPGHPGERGHDRGRHTGRPDEFHGKKQGHGPQDDPGKGLAKGHDKSHDKDHGKGHDNGHDKSHGNGHGKGTGGGRPADHPR